MLEQVLTSLGYGGTTVSKALRPFEDGVAV
jgi:hypothetical protein